MAMPAPRAGVPDPRGHHELPVVAGAEAREQNHSHGDAVFLSCDSVCPGGFGSGSPACLAGRPPESFVWVSSACRVSFVASATCSGGPPGGPFVGSRHQTQRKHSCALRSIMYVCNRTTPRQRKAIVTCGSPLEQVSKRKSTPVDSAETQFPAPTDAARGAPRLPSGFDLADSCSWLAAPWRDPISGYALARLSCHETLFLPNDDPGILASATTASPISHAPAGGSWPSGPRHPRRLCSVVRLVSPSRDRRPQANNMGRLQSPPTSDGRASSSSVALSPPPPPQPPTRGMEKILCIGPLQWNSTVG